MYSVSFAVRRTRIGLAAILIGVPLAALATQTTVHAAEALPPAVEADYRISLNGFDIGTLHYTAQVAGGRYSVGSDVELSLLLGAFKWKGVSRTSGTLAGTAIRPESFAFDFSSPLKTGNVRLGFERGAIRQVSVNPEGAPAPDTVPLAPEHLKSVLDPLSAVMALTLPTSATTGPCQRKVSIFDGKQRFDLELAYRREERIADGRDTASVCRIKYVPIGGYRNNEETANMAAANGIEISFRHVSGSALNVPHRVVLPTVAGPAEISIERINFKAAAAGQVAQVD